MGVYEGCPVGIPGCGLVTAMAAHRAEEFEADSGTCWPAVDTTSNTLLKNYMPRQLFRLYSPEIATRAVGFLNQKRFKMMTTKTPGRHSLAATGGHASCRMLGLPVRLLHHALPKSGIVETEKTRSTTLRPPSDETKRRFPLRLSKMANRFRRYQKLIAGG